MLDWLIVITTMVSILDCRKLTETLLCIKICDNRDLRGSSINEYFDIFINKHLKQFKFPCKISS